jgi:hypothetical protein
MSNHSTSTKNSNEGAAAIDLDELQLVNEISSLLGRGIDESETDEPVTPVYNFVIDISDYDTELSRLLVLRKDGWFE